MLDREAIERILPHRDPFLWIDRIIELDPGKRAVGEWDLDPELPFFKGHFPGHPVVPGVLLVESIAQAGAVTILSLPENAGRLVLFGGIDRARFRKQVLPGDTVRLEINITQLRSRAGRGEGKAYVGDHLACEADVLFVFDQ